MLLDSHEKTQAGYLGRRIVAVILPEEDFLSSYAFSGLIVTIKGDMRKLKMDINYSKKGKPPEEVPFEFQDKLDVDLGKGIYVDIDNSNTSVVIDRIYQILSDEGNIGSDLLSPRTSQIDKSFVTKVFSNAREKCAEASQQRLSDLNNTLLSITSAIINPLI